jgi:hypothetical protein
MCDSENMKLYNQFRVCPKEAQKPISAGRLKGKTDINPMWRLKKLTEAFGPCGIGWTYRIVRTWIENGAIKRQFNDSGQIIAENSEMTANVEIALRFKYDGAWSEEIPGIGGAMFCELESRGFNTEDEAYKKALTDAISVACKALGVAADIYYAKDPDSKYDVNPDAPMQPPMLGIPFPEAERKPEAPKPLPNPANFGKEQKPMTRERAAATLYNGMTLADLYKKQRAVFMEIFNNPPSAEIGEATKILLDWVNSSRSAS